MNDVLLPLRAGAALLETDHLDYVEEDGADRVRRLRVHVLQTPAEGRVAVAVRPGGFRKKRHQRNRQFE